MDGTTMTVAGISLFGMALAEMLAKRKLTGNDWPNQIPPSWPEAWRKKFTMYRVNPNRTKISREIKKQVLELCKRNNRRKVRDYEWATRSGDKVTAGTMSWSHLINTIKFCARNKNWGPWVYFVAEHRLRLMRCRKRDGVPTSRLTMSKYDEDWERGI